MSGKLLLIYIWNFHVLSNLLLIYICKLHWNPPYSNVDALLSQNDADSDTDALTVITAAAIKLLVEIHQMTTISVINVSDNPGSILLTKEFVCFLIVRIGFLCTGEEYGFLLGFLRGYSCSLICSSDMPSLSFGLDLLQALVCTPWGLGSGKFLLIYIWNFHVLSHLLLIYICKLHWNLNTMFVCQVIYFWFTYEISMS